MWLHESNPHFRRRVRKDFFVLVGLYLSVFCLLFQPKQGGKHVSSWQNEGKSYQTNKPTSFSIWTNRHAVILDSCLYFSDCLLHCSSFNGSEKETICPLSWNFLFFRHWYYRPVNGYIVCVLLIILMTHSCSFLCTERAKGSVKTHCLSSSLILTFFLKGQGMEALSTL